MKRQFSKLHKGYVNPMNCEELVKEYRSLGLKPILCRGKESITAGFGQRKRLDYETEIYPAIESKIQKNNYNVGLICGEASGIFVIDEDKPGAFSRFNVNLDWYAVLPENVPTVKTPSGGYHYYFRYDSSLKDVLSKAGFVDGLDIRSNYSYIMAPGSTYPGCCKEDCPGDCNKCKNINGVYTWDNPPKIKDGKWVLPVVPHVFMNKFPVKEKLKVSTESTFQKTKDIISPDDKDFYSNIFLSLLSPQRASEYNDWMTGCFIILNLTENSELVHAFSKRTEKGNYDESAVDNLIKSFSKERNPPGVGTLRMWLNEDIGEDKTKALFKSSGLPVTRLQYDILQKTQAEYVDLYLKLKEGNLMADPLGKKYIFNPKTALWDIIEDFTGSVNTTLKEYFFDVFDYAFDGNTLYKKKYNDIGSLPYLGQMSKRINSIMDASSYPKIFLDRSPNTFPIKNRRVIDFLTLEIRERTKNDFFTWESPVDLTDETDSAKKYILDISNGDPELALFMEEMFGYQISGYTFLKRMFMETGGADSGKTTLNSHILGYILGPTTSPVSKNVLLVNHQRNKAGNPELLSVANTRMMTITELDSERDVLDCEFIKNIVGGDPIDPVRINGGNTMYKPTLISKPVLYTNNLPKLKDTDNTFTSKIIWIPFNNTFKRTSSFLENFKVKSMDGFFTLIARGLNRLLKRGINEESLIIPLASSRCEERGLTEVSSPLVQLLTALRAPGKECPFETFYNHYVQQTGDYNTSKFSIGKLIQKWATSKKYPDVMSYKKKIHGRVVTVIMGISSPDEEEEDPTKNPV